MKRKLTYAIYNCDDDYMAGFDSISEVAKYLGYDNPQTFSRLLCRNKDKNVYYPTKDDYYSVLLYSNKYLKVYGFAEK